MMPIHKDILHQIQDDITKVVHVISSLLMYLGNKIIQSSLLTSLQSKFLRSSLLIYLQNGFIRSSLFVSLQSNFVFTSPLTSLWEMFLRHLYKDISIVTPIQIKPETFKSLRRLQVYISTIAFIQVKPETDKSWIASHSSIQPYIKYFRKLITQYITDYNHSTDTDKIRRQLVGYIMSLKRKQRTKLKVSSPEEDKHHLMFNNVLPSDSDLLYTNTHKGCWLLNANEYNYKLRSVIGQEDESKVTKWKLLNKQVRDTLLCSQIRSRKLVDHTNIGRAIGHLLSLVYAPSAGMRAVSDLQHHSFIHQWWCTLDQMITYIYISSYTKVCCLHC